MASSPKDHEVIDVGSGPALFEGRGRRALTLDGADELGREEEDEDQDDDNDDSQSTRAKSTRTAAGSPGDELRTDHLMLDDDDGDMAGHMAGIGVQRLRRLRGRRGFFHSDADGRSFRYRSSGGILQRITLRRRKREDHDVFWTAIGVLTVLSFALMSCITIYLTQTDFFESHQNDLFGTTVDNRFTVVAEDDAEIFLKSGYSNSVYSEGMIAFDDGELKIGRRALESEDLQTFYGVTFFSNGTSTFTNRLESPMIEADYLSARKGVIFDDGTVMTTAANSSGGVKEQGDLNLVSKAGAVVTSAGGNGGSDGDDGARALDSTSSAEESTSVTLEVVGQTSSTQKEGGGIRIVGGDGMNFGGDVTLVGGQATDSESEQVSLIANEIGSHGSTHEVNIHGLVSFNQNSGVNDTTEIKRITLDNRATSLSELHVNSNDVRLGASSPSVQVGKAGLSTRNIGTSDEGGVIGDRAGCSHSVAINTLNREAITTISGLVHFNGSSTTSSLLSITDTAVRANPPRFRVGAKGKTSIASIEANHVSIGEPGANATTLPSTGSKLELFSSSITVGSEGKSVVIDATETLAVGEQVDEVTLGSEDVSKINVQGEAVSVAAKVVSIGVDSPTVNIGSDASTINLSGSVTINGKALSSRRLAGQSDVWSDTNSKRFGYLDADRFTIPVTQINTMTKFALRWDNGFSSEPHAYQVDTSKERMLSVPSVMGSDNELASRHLQISLHISSLMLVVQSEDLAAQPSKIRCRVYRHTAERSDAVAMEVNALVEHCFGTACEGGIFLGLQGQRIVPYNTGDSFSTQCALASTAPGELLLQGAQYSFAEQ
ncbi:hypothetical protein GQ600_17334 [Phytophthora cactorum]|nr:hypothetical protein GQ600_17334 [Phytophthora cactorum]